MAREWGTDLLSMIFCRFNIKMVLVATGLAVWESTTNHSLSKLQRSLRNVAFCDIFCTDLIWAVYEHEESIPKHLVSFFPFELHTFALFVQSSQSKKYIYSSCRVSPIIPTRGKIPPLSPATSLYSSNLYHFGDHPEIVQIRLYWWPLMVRISPYHQ